MMAASVLRIAVLAAVCCVVHASSDTGEKRNGESPPPLTEDQLQEQTKEIENPLTQKEGMSEKDVPRNASVYRSKREVTHNTRWCCRRAYGYRIERKTALGSRIKTKILRSGTVRKCGFLYGYVCRDYTTRQQTYVEYYVRIVPKRIPDHTKKCPDNEIYCCHGYTNYEGSCLTSRELNEVRDLKRQNGENLDTLQSRLQQYKAQKDFAHRYIH